MSEVNRVVEGEEGESSRPERTTFSGVPVVKDRLGVATDNIRRLFSLVQFNESELETPGKTYITLYTLNTNLFRPQSKVKTTTVQGARICSLIWRDSTVKKDTFDP